MSAPRFTLRDLFWLIVVVAIGLAWWLDRIPRHERVAKLEDKVAVRLERSILCAELTAELKIVLEKRRRMLMQRGGLRTAIKGE
jgi:hypothetical protein